MSVGGGNCNKEDQPQCLVLISWSKFKHLNSIEFLFKKQNSYILLTAVEELLCNWNSP